MTRKFILLAILALLIFSCNTRNQFHETEDNNPKYKPNTVFVGNEDLNSPRFWYKYHCHGTQLLSHNFQLCNYRKRKLKFIFHFVFYWSKMNFKIVKNSSFFYKIETEAPLYSYAINNDDYEIKFQIEKKILLVFMEYTDPIVACLQYPFKW